MVSPEFDFQRRCQGEGWLLKRGSKKIKYKEFSAVQVLVNNPPVTQTWPLGWRDARSGSLLYFFSCCLISSDVHICVCGVGWGVSPSDKFRQCLLQTKEVDDISQATSFASYTSCRRLWFIVTSQWNWSVFTCASDTGYWGMHWAKTFHSRFQGTMFTAVAWDILYW